MGIAKRVVLVADSGTFGRGSYVRVAPLAAAHEIVTDTNLPAPCAEQIAESGTRLHLAGLDMPSRG